MTTLVCLVHTTFADDVNQPAFNVKLAFGNKLHLHFYPCNAVNHRSLGGNRFISSVIVNQGFKA